MLFLFVDGFGIGPDDPDRNPVAAARLPALTRLAGGRRPVAAPATRSPEVPTDGALRVARSPDAPADGAPLADLRADGPPGDTRDGRWVPLDARLGVPGLPQSGTGQTALLTGINAPAALGRHDGPYPPRALRPILAERSIWRRLLAAGRRVALANAYPDRYLDRARLGQGRMGAVARSADLAGVRLRGPDDLRRGDAVSAFLANDGWREHLGYADMPRITEHDAGRNLARLAERYDFTLFEYYATDLAGHRPDRWSPAAALEGFDRFLDGVMEGWSEQDVLVMASDHGNIEDAATRRHTLNPALGVWRGPPPTRPLAALTDVAPAVVGALGA